MNISELTREYMSGKIDVEELRQLQQAVAQTSDAELNQILFNIWYNYDIDIHKIDEFDTIIRKIQPPKREKRISLKTIFTFAASLLLPLFIALHIYYYNENNRLHNFINEDVIMQVESGEKANIILPDGTKVFLNTETTISYARDYGLKTREVKLTGEAFLDVAHNEDMPFYLNTDYVQIKVLGTKFNINAYHNSNFVEATLIDGSINLTTKDADPQSIIMLPNQKATYHKDSGILLVDKKNTTHFETAWMKGELVFRSAKFEDIMTKLEQRYGVNIKLENPDKCSTDLFTGSFKEDYANGVLKILQLHYDFNYTDTNGELRIYFNNMDNKKAL